MKVRGVKPACVAARQNILTMGASSAILKPGYSRFQSTSTCAPIISAGFVHGIVHGTAHPLDICLFDRTALACHLTFRGDDIVCAATGYATDVGRAIHAHGTEHAAWRMRSTAQHAASMALTPCSGATPA